MVNTSGKRMNVSGAPRASLLISPLAFPLQVFPPWISLLCEMIARMLGTSVNLVAMTMLAIISAVVVGRIGVVLGNDYFIPGQIYMCLVGQPGAAKSGIISILSGFLTEHYTNRNNTTVIENTIIRRKISNLDSQVSDSGIDENQMRNLLYQKSSIMLRPEYEEFLTNVTPESLISRLDMQAGNGVILSTEPTILEQLTRGSSSGGYVNIEPLLKGFCGEPIKLTRISRPNEVIKSANLSILVGAQTDVAAGFVRDVSLKRTGLTARFVFGYDPMDIVAREDVGNIQDLLDSWKQLIIYLADMNRPATGTAYIDPIRVSCDSDADAYITALNNFNRLESITSLADEAGFVAKTDQYLAKLSLLCKLMHDPTARVLDLNDVMRGSDIFDYCLGTLRALEGASSLSPAEMSLLRAIIDVTKSADNGVFPQMAPYRKIKGQSTFTGTAGTKNYMNALQHLYGLGYIQLVEKANTKGGPNTMWYKLVATADEIETGLFQ